MLKKLKNQKGGILVLLSMTIPIILLIASGSYMVYSYTIAHEQIEASAKMVLLAAAEEYFDTPCTDYDENEINDCHNTIKMPAAITRANEVVALNSKYLGSLEIGSPDTDSVTAGVASLEGGRYYYKDPTNQVEAASIQAECANNFPCYVGRKTNTLANAFSLSGTVSGNKMLLALSNLFGLKFGSKKKDFRIFVNAIPMRMCAVIDMSRSTTYNTHPIEGAASRYYSYPLYLSTSSYIDGELLPVFKDSWDAMGNSRSGDGSADISYKDDYARIVSYKDDLDGYNDYASVQFDGKNYSSYHSEPKAEHLPSGLGSSSGYHRGYRSFYVDLFRNPDYTGPEPWLSIIKGVNETLDIFENRSVAGDKVCLIFYNDTLSWKGIINLTDNFDYLRKVVDPLDVSTELHHDPSDNEAKLWDLADAPTNNGIPTSVFDANWDKSISCLLDQAGCMPLWARLGLFPMTGTQTNSPAAFREVISQFANDSTGVPSIDFITHFSDGLTTCFSENGSTDCNASSHYYYLKSMQQMEGIAMELFQANISLHHFSVGDAVRPHTILLDDGEGECLTDEDARKKKPPVDFVHNQGFSAFEMSTHTEDSRAAYTAYRSPEEGEERQPFFQANADWYNLVRMTGGIWAPLRPAAVDCDSSVAATPNCGGNDLESSSDQELMLDSDPGCRDIDLQIRAYLDEALESASGFNVIEVSPVQ